MDVPHSKEHTEKLQTDRCRRETMERQPLWSTVGLSVIVICCIGTIYDIRMRTNEIPTGLINIAVVAVTALAMSAGRRRT